MTVTQLTQALELRTVVEGDGDREVTGGYAGDLLSWVMGRAQPGDAWITVIGNVNAVAVAVLADAACILLSEGAALDPDAAERAVAQEVTVLCSDKTTFRLAAELAARL